MEREDLEVLRAELGNWGLDSGFIPGVQPIKLVANTFLASAIAVGGYCSFSDRTLPDGCVYESEWDDMPQEDSAYCFDNASFFNEFNDSPVPSLPIRIEQHFRDRLFDAEMRESWQAQGIEPPNAECYAKAFNVLSYVYNDFGMLPSKVVATKASSLLIEYRNSRVSSTLRLEVDNDLDVIGVVSTSDKSIVSGDFESDFADRAIAVFQGRATTTQAT